MTDPGGVAARGATAGGDGIVERVRLASYAWAESDGAVLLCRMSAGQPGAGRWTLPGGGLEFGEHPEDGLERELAEETGLTGAVDELLAVRSVLLEPGETVSGHRIQAVSILYRVTIDGGELRAETDGSTDLAAWVPLADLPRLATVRLVGWARSAAGH